MSLFGSSTATATKPSLFGSTPASTQQSSAGTLFGAGTQTSQAASSGNLFGSTTTQQSSAGSLFGSTTTNQQTGGSLFGNNNAISQPQQSSSLFGNTAQSSAPEQPSLFGSVNNTAAQPATGGGLFGSTTAKPAGGGLFGSSTATATQPATTSLFGNTLNSQPQPAKSLFGSLNQPASTFGASHMASQQQQQHPLPTDGSLLRSSNFPNANHLLGQSQNAPARPSIWAPNQSVPNPNRTIPEQIVRVSTKWNARSSASDLTHYFYNFVGEHQALFCRPGPGEDEKVWDEALSKKPGPGYVPVLAVGFQDLGARVILQQNQMNAYQVRMHEIDASLKGLTQKHDLAVNTRASDARKRHEELTRRCLRLATKVQVLRNRGYAMEPKEEELKQRIVALVQKVEDPVNDARRDLVWNRMMVIRDKMAMLQEDMGWKVEETKRAKLDDTTARKIEKILMDYASQIQHLRKELEVADKELDDYRDEDVTPKKAQPRR